MSLEVKRTWVGFVSGALLLFGGIWVYTQTPADLVFQYQSTLSTEGRVLDVAVSQDRVYVLTGDSGGTKAHIFDRITWMKSGVLDAHNALAMAPDPSSGMVYLLATTRKRGPYHYIYVLDPSTNEITQVSTLEDQYTYRSYIPGFVATGRGELIVNNRVSSDLPELVVIDQATGVVARYIDLPPVLSDASKPRLSQGEYFYRLRRLSSNEMSALGVNTGNFYVVNVADGSIVHEESLGVPDAPPILDEATGQLHLAPVVFDVYHTNGYRFEITNGFPIADGSEVINPDGSRSRLDLDGPQLAVADVSYTAIERISPTEWLGVDSIHLHRVDRLTAR